MYSIAYLAEKLLHRCKHPAGDRNGRKKGDE